MAGLRTRVTVTFGGLAPPDGRVQRATSGLRVGHDGGPARLVDFAALLRATDGTVVAAVGAHGHGEWVGEVIEALRSQGAQERRVPALGWAVAGRLSRPQPRAGP